MTFYTHTFSSSPVDTILFLRLDKSIDEHGDTCMYSSTPVAVFGITLHLQQFGRIGYKQITQIRVYRLSFALHRTLELVVILHISQIHFTPEFFKIYTFALFTTVALQNCQYFIYYKAKLDRFTFVHVSSDVNMTLNECLFSSDGILHSRLMKLPFKVFLFEGLIMSQIPEAVLLNGLCHLR